MITFVKGPGYKKYTAIITMNNGKKKKVNFGDKRYQHYKDRTSKKIWNHLDHNDPQRRKQYRARHSKIKLKDGRIAKNVRYTPAWFSWNYLW